MSINEMKEKKVWAVIGATEDREKFGNRIFRRLLDRKKTVYPVNPKYPQVEGYTCYKSLAELPEKPEVLDMVIAPEYGRAYVDEALRLGIRNFWFQPGSHSPELLNYVREQGGVAVTACVLVEL